MLPLISTFLLFLNCASINSEVQVSLYTRSKQQGEGITLNIDRCTNVPENMTSLVSASTNDCVMLYSHDCCQGFAIQATDSVNFVSNSQIPMDISSISPCDDYRALFPQLSVEKWGLITESMRKVSEYTDTAVYYNEKTVLCPVTMRAYADFIDQVWGYVKYIYGNSFGPEGSILFAYFHGGIQESVAPYARNHYFKESSCRNVIHMTQSKQSAWTGGKKTSERMDEILRAVSVLVAYTVKRVYYNPAGSDDVWGFEAEPFTEIFTYDVYRGLQMEYEAQRVLEKFWNKSHPFPVGSDTFWFRNWWFPLYTKYGGARILDNYFDVLARHFPRMNVMEWSYERVMDLGEFVHLFSGAVGSDLKGLAMEAFPWDLRFEQQLAKAKREFPKVRYL